jgi:acetyl-CoA carboxylase alpha subunit
MYKTLKAELKKMLKDLMELSKDELVMQRVDKFSEMGVYNEG